MKTRFPNRAGDHPDTDEILRAELHAAGLQTLQEAEGKPPEFLADLLRRNSGEVKTSVIGSFHGWEFKRAWYYWMVKGPGLDIKLASALHETHGKEVRVAGHCGCPHPREWYNGFAVPDYHVDTPEGLKALVDALKAVYEDNQRIMKERNVQTESSDENHSMLDRIEVAAVNDQITEDYNSAKAAGEI
jgi:hypothetical protein